MYRLAELEMRMNTYPVNMEKRNVENRNKSCETVANRKKL